MRRLRSNALFALPSVGSGRPAGLEDTGVAGAAAYSLNDGNVPQRKRLTIAEPRCEPCLFAGGKAPRTQPRRTNLAVSWSEDPGGGPRIVGDPRWVETDERNAPQIAFGDQVAIPGPRSRGPDYAEGGCPVRGQRPMRTPQLCVIGRTAIALAGLGGWNCTTIGTYLFQTETIRYREISYRKRPYDGRLLPHCCHCGVERIVSVVIRSQRWELRDACAVYRSLPGWKPYADFRHRAGRGCSLGTGLCVRIFGKMGGF